MWQYYTMTWKNISFYFHAMILYRILISNIILNSDGHCWLGESALVKNHDTQTNRHLLGFQSKCIIVLNIDWLMLYEYCPISSEWIATCCYLISLLSTLLCGTFLNKLCYSRTQNFTHMMRYSTLFCSTFMIPCQFIITPGPRTSTCGDCYHWSISGELSSS